MNTKFGTFRWKMLFLFILSGILAAATVVLLLAIAIVLENNILLFNQILRLLERTLGAPFTVILVGILFFILYFFLLTQSMVKYLHDMKTGLEKVAQGDFTTRLPVRSGDELGVLAEGINLMMVQLKDFFEEERNSERSKRDLITSVSHDLRTPLTSILGYLELVVNNLYRDEEALRYCVEIAYNKSKKLNELIDELFEYTRVSYGGLKAHYQQINIVELLEQLVEEFVPLFQDAGMTCRFTPPEKPVMISADANMLVRVFENLLTNAIRYGQEGKYIDLYLEEKDQVHIRFVNYGEPISARDLPYLFERFYRVDKSRSQNSGGTGLGLAIAKNIVELHGGEITASSDVQRGTVFVVKLNKQPADR